MSCTIINSIIIGLNTLLLIRPNSEITFLTITLPYFTIYLGIKLILVYNLCRLYLKTLMFAIGVKWGPPFNTCRLPLAAKH